MAVAKMAKIMIVSHRSEAAQLLEEVQNKGIVEILDAERAIVSKDWPELVVEESPPKDIEQMVSRTSKSIAFLEQHGKTRKGLLNVLSPKTIVSDKQYHKVVSGNLALQFLDEAEKCQSAMEQLQATKEKITSQTEMLTPWRHLSIPLNEIADSQRTTVLAGLMTSQNVERVEEQLKNKAAVFEIVGTSKDRVACVVISLKENAAEVQKILRSLDFEQVIFEQMHGTAGELIKQYRQTLASITEQLKLEKAKAAELAGHTVTIQILADHYQNLAARQQVQAKVPVTEHVVFLEGWVREKDIANLENTVSRYPASSLARISPTEEEQIPVDIVNKPLIRPFEVITRLHGMPQTIDVDPTIFLAPFFILFFGICLSDAGYGLATIVATALIIRKIQGDKKLLWLLMFCSFAAVGFGIITGSWFGDIIDKFLPSLVPLKNKMVLFNPFIQIKLFLGISLALGYIHIMFGLGIAFVNNLTLKDYMTAFCNKLSWLVMLNSIVIFGLSKAGAGIPPMIGKFFGMLSLIPAASILLFSHREGGIGTRLGMGFFNLFSAIFYMGDVLSYLRLMGLAMVGTGMAMAINIIAKVALDIPYGIGIILALLILVGGHIFNMLLSLLGAFVHTLRLQYVEFFPKFFSGGGKAFEPLSKQYKYIMIQNGKV